jgi:hypothetical protein
LPVNVLSRGGVQQDAHNQGETLHLDIGAPARIVVPRPDPCRDRGELPVASVSLPISDLSIYRIGVVPREVKDLPSAREDYLRLHGAVLMPRDRPALRRLSPPDMISDADHLNLDLSRITSICHLQAQVSADRLRIQLDVN